MNSFRGWYFLMNLYLWLMALFAVLAIVGPLVTMFLCQQKKPVIIMDGAGNYHQVVSVDFKDAKALQVECVRSAVRALLNRTSTGTDDEALLRQCFLSSCKPQIDKIFAEDKVQFELKNIHQRVEVGKVELIRVTGKNYIANVSGQLVRACEYMKQQFVEVRRFVLVMQMAENPDISTNGKLPLAAAAINRYETEENK